MKIKKILISKSGGIGDVVLTTPVIYELKRMYPAVKVSLLILPNALQAVERLSFIDDIIIYDKKKHSTFSLWKKLLGYDTAVFFDLQYRIAWISFLAGIKVRGGLEHKRKFWLTKTVKWQPYMDETYEPYVFSDVLKEVTGLVLDRKKLDKLYFSPYNEEEEKIVQQKLQAQGVDLEKGYVVSSPVTAFFLKNWALEKWSEFYQKFYEKFKLPIIVFGTSYNLNTNFFQGQAGIVNLTDQLDLFQTAALIAKAKLLINACSLPLHIASAFLVPSVALYGCTSIERWAPRTKCKVVSADFPCSFCDVYQGTKCKEPLCMQAITAEMVLKACEEFLKDI